MSDGNESDSSSNSDVSLPSPSIMPNGFIMDALPFQDLNYIPYGSESSSTETPFVESPPSIVRRAIELLQVSAGDCVLDLGCGVGDFLNKCVLQVDGCTGLGIDNNDELIEEAVQTAKDKGIADRVTYKCASFLESKSWATECNKIYMYLVPKAIALPHLQTLLLDFLQRGNTIVAYKFPLHLVNENFPRPAVHDKILEMFLYKVNTDTMVETKNEEGGE